MRSLSSEFANPVREIELLAALARRAEAYWEVADIVRPEDFSEPHGRIFFELAEAIKADKKPGPVEDLPEATPAANPAEVAKELRELAKKRWVAHMIETVAADLPEKNADELMAGLEEHMAAVGKVVREPLTEMKTAADILPALKEDVARRHKVYQETGRTIFGIPTGIDLVDKETTGLFPGIHLLAAEPRCGKTTLSLQIATHAAKQGYPVIFVSFEEPVEKLTLKALCGLARKRMKEFRQGIAGPEDLDRMFAEHGSTISTLRFVTGASSTTTATMKAKVNMMKAATGAPSALVIVDYLQKWASLRRDFSDYRHVVGALLAELRDLALTTNSAVLAISSQNRSGYEENGKGGARLGSLKESGDLEYGGDTIMFLVNGDSSRPTTPGKEEKEVVLHLMKNREGDWGKKINLTFEPAIGRFKPASSQFAL